MSTNNQELFYKLVRAGLWEKSDKLNVSRSKIQGSVDWNEVYRLAREQSVIGLVLAGLESSKVKPQQELLLQWIGEVQILEQQNTAMNGFIAVLIEKLRNADIYALLVKGQGIAQCYERPLWRCCGDVDLFLSASNYDKAKTLFSNLASHIDAERTYNKHLAFEINDWEVELHGSLRCSLWNSVNRILGEIQKEILYNGAVRSWMNGQTQVFIPDANEDVVYVFTHILNHFFRGGIGLRQICDWCRLLWTYRSKLDLRLLESRIRKMGLMSEWNAFGAFAVGYLGMQAEAMPFYDSRYVKKADRIMEFVLETGNFGHNRELRRSKNFFVGKIQAAWFKMGDFARHAKLFPWDSVRFYCHYLVDGIRQAYAKKFS